MWAWSECYGHALYPAIIIHVDSLDPRPHFPVATSLETRQILIGLDSRLPLHRASAWIRGYLYTGLQIASFLGPGAPKLTLKTR